MKTKDGYIKLIEGKVKGDGNNVLLSDGGNAVKSVTSTANSLVLRNASGLIESSVATGTSPFKITSTTLNTNLNADLLDGKHLSEILASDITGTSSRSKQLVTYTVVPFSNNTLNVWYKFASISASGKYSGLFANFKLYSGKKTLTSTLSSECNISFNCYLLNEVGLVPAYGITYDNDSEFMEVVVILNYSASGFTFDFYARVLTQGYHELIGVLINGSGLFISNGVRTETLPSGTQITPSYNKKVKFAVSAEEASKATNLSSGSLGAIPYQTAANTTTFLVAATTNGAVLKYDTTNKKPYWSTDNNSWRPVKLTDGSTETNVVNDNSSTLKFKAGNNVTLSTSGGVITISSTDTDTWTAWKGATASAAGTAGYMPAPTAALRNQFLRGDGQWVSLNNYSLPTASSSTLGGVKTGSAITDTTGYTPISIKDGILYYKDNNTTYDLSNYLTERGNISTSYVDLEVYEKGASGYLNPYNGVYNVPRTNYSEMLIAFSGSGSTSGLDLYTHYSRGSIKFRHRIDKNRLDGAWITLLDSNNSEVSLSGQTLTVKINGTSKSLTNTWTAWAGATASVNGTAGYMPAATSAQRNLFLRGDGQWVSLNNYSLPTASDTVLGGVKTGAVITDVTGYTKVHIKDGVLYYKDTDANSKVNVVSRGTTKAYLLGTTTSPTSTAQAVTSVAETGVYFDTTAATLVATTFKGNLTGTASNASKLSDTSIVTTGKGIYVGGKGNTVAGTSPSWCKICSFSTGNTTDGKCDYAFWVHSSYNDRYGILNIRVRGTSSNGYIYPSMLLNCGVVLDNIRVYYDANIDKIELWAYGGNSYSVYNFLLIYATSRSGSSVIDNMTFYSSTAGTPSLPNYKIPTLKSIENTTNASSNIAGGAAGSIPYLTASGTTAFLAGSGTNGYVLKYNTSTKAPYWAADNNDLYVVVTSSKDGLVPKFDAVDGTIDNQSNDWVLTNNNGTIGWYKLPSNAFNDHTYDLSPYYKILELMGSSSGAWDWDSYSTIGTYKVQAGSSITNHPKYNGTNNAYQYGLAMIIRGMANDGEGRISQIYFPHNATGNIPMYIRMRNSNTWTDWWGIPSTTYVDNKCANYLPLSGGTLTSSTYATQLIINRNLLGANSVIKFTNSDGDLGNIGFCGSNGTHPGELIVRKGNSNYKIWHEGNLTPSDYLPLTGGIIKGNLHIKGNATTINRTKASVMLVNTEGVAGIDWAFGVVTLGSTAVNAANCGVGIILSGYSSGSDSYTIGRGAGIAAVVEENWYNKTGIAFYVNHSNSSSSDNCTEKIRINHVGNIIPMYNTSQTLGSSDKYWNNVYTSKINGYTPWHSGNLTPSNYLLASSYTASDVLTKLKTVDGAGSGLDADTLDGSHLSDILGSNVASATKLADKLVFTSTGSGYRKIMTLKTNVRYGGASGVVLFYLGTCVTSTGIGKICKLYCLMYQQNAIGGAPCYSLLTDCEQSTSLKLYAILNYSSTESVIDIYIYVGYGYCYTTGVIISGSNLGFSLGDVLSSLPTTGTLLTIGNFGISQYANQLSTSRTIWGQSFNGTGNITGNLSNVGNIVTNSSNTDIYLKLSTDSRSWWTGIGITSGDDKYIIYDATAKGHRLAIDTSGNVGINTTSPNYRLDVNGTIHANEFRCLATSDTYKMLQMGVASARNLRLHTAAGFTGVSGRIAGLSLYEGDSCYGTVGVCTTGPIWINSSSSVYTLLHSGNYNSYSPTLNGTGATGTWGIDISGLANTANTLKAVGLPGATTNVAGAWCKFARITFNRNSYDPISGYLFFSSGESTDHMGILYYHCRASLDKTVTNFVRLIWLVRNSSTLSVIAVKVGNNIYDLYMNNYGAWTTPRVQNMLSTGVFEWSVGSWTTTKPTAAYTASDEGMVSYATSAGSASTATSATSATSATTATKLATARTIWGQSFDGSANISGAISNTGAISSSKDSTYDIGSSTNQYRYMYASWFGAKTGGALSLGANNANHVKIDTSGNVGIGTTSPSYKLHVAGTAGFSDKVVMSKGFATGWGDTSNDSDGTARPWYGCTFSGSSTANNVMLSGYYGITYRTGDTSYNHVFKGGHVRPDANNTQTLGTSSYKWNNVYATTFTGALSGNASTASKLATARTISLTGSVTGSVSFDGSGNVSITTTTNHTHAYVARSGSGFNQYNTGTYVKILEFTISSGSLSPSISFSWHPTECARDIWADFNINIRANDISFKANWKGGNSRTLTCVGNGTTFSVWVTGTKTSWDPYGVVQVTHTYAINSYSAGTLQVTDTVPSGTYSKACATSGYSASAGNADTVDSYHISVGAAGTNSSTIYFVT